MKGSSNTPKPEKKVTKGALKSLAYDLQQIRKTNLQNITAMPLEGDIFCWHGCLIAQGKTNKHE
jgi:hypothetical protein